MPQIDFYNQNSYITFPFVTTAPAPRLGSLAWTNDTILDAGFVIESRFAPIMLARAMVKHTGGTPFVRLMFTCGGQEMNIEVELSAPPGTVVRAGGRTWDGYVVVGAGFANLSRYPEGTSSFIPALEVEPGTSQWLHEAWVEALDIANIKNGVGAIQTAGLTGDIPFEPGNNSAIAARVDLNTMEFRDDLGGGAGLPCFPEDTEELPCAGFINTINGNGPDAYGEFKILGANGVMVHNFPEEHRIEIDFAKALVDATCEV